MKAIIIAAGSCTRLRPLTDSLPKCMLKIKGKPIVENIIGLFRDNGINDISLIRGYLKQKINFSNINYFENNDYVNNNILHSLMCARPKLEECIKDNEDVIVTYSDIWYTNKVVKKLMDAGGSIASIIDTDWQEYYDNRSDHPIEEAENVIMDDNGVMLKIGKHIFTDKTPKDKQGEFIGLWKFTATGVKIFLDHFDRLNSTLTKIDSFQNTKEWQKAYITDIFQELIDQGEQLNCVLIKKNWAEFDTVQDFKKAEQIINNLNK